MKSNRTCVRNKTILDRCKKETKLVDTVMKMKVKVVKMKVKWISKNQLTFLKISSDLNTCLLPSLNTEAGLSQTAIKLMLAKIFYQTLHAICIEPVSPTYLYIRQ